MNTKIHILLLEDNPRDAELLRETLRSSGLTCDVFRVETEDSFRKALENNYDLIISDYTLPAFDGKKALAAAKQKQPNTPFIFVSGTIGEEAAIESLQSGATDYVLKTRLSRLVPAVQRALREAGDRAERRRTEERLKKSHEQLRALSMYLQHVREDERIRISRQVHDELGQALTGLKMDLYWLSTRLPKQLRAVREKTKTMSAHIDSTIQTVRRISTELRPGILDDLGLVAALEWQAGEFQKRTAIKCDVASELPDPILDEELNTAFFRNFQESLTNVVRHANASRVDVRLWQDEANLWMEIKDNGRGISEAELSNTRSIGLLGMRERAALLGGEVIISGMPGQGTAVRVRIPREQPVTTEPRKHENSYRRRPRSRAAWAEADSGR